MWKCTFSPNDEPKRWITFTAPVSPPSNPNAAARFAYQRRRCCHTTRRTPEHRSGRRANRYRLGQGILSTHWRTVTRGTTWSIRCAARGARLGGHRPPTTGRTQRASVTAKRHHLRQAAAAPQQRKPQRRIATVAEPVEVAHHMTRNEAAALFGPVHQVPDAAEHQILKHALGRREPPCRRAIARTGPTLDDAPSLVESPPHQRLIQPSPAHRR